MITVVANLKGGSGKSTISFHLILWLLSNNIRTLAVDLDPQMTLTDIVEVREEENITPKITLTNSSLMDARLNLEDYSEVVVDVGAQSMVELKYALIKADILVVPVMPSQADIWATQRFMKLVKMLRKSNDLPKIYSVVNRGDLNPNNYDTIDTQETLGLINDMNVAQTIIYDREDFRSSLYEGMACFEFNPVGAAANEFREFAKLVYNY